MRKEKDGITKKIRLKNTNQLLSENKLYSGKRLAFIVSRGTFEHKLEWELG